MYVQQSKGVSDLKFDMNMHRCPYVVYASGNSIGETAQLHRVVWVLAVRICDKYRTLINLWKGLVSLLLMMVVVMDPGGGQGVL